jgi:hypothetical protein
MSFWRTGRCLPPAPRSVLPVEYLLSASPKWAINFTGELKRRTSPISAMIVTALINATPRKACKALTTKARVHSGTIVLRYDLTIDLDARLRSVQFAIFPEMQIHEHGGQNSGIAASDVIASSMVWCDSRPVRGKSETLKRAVANAVGPPLHFPRCGPGRVSPRVFHRVPRSASIPWLAPAVQAEWRPAETYRGQRRHHYKAIKTEGTQLSEKPVSRWSRIIRGSDTWCSTGNSLEQLQHWLEHLSLCLSSKLRQDCTI